MPISTTTNLGVSARLSLDYKSVQLIKKLFNIGKPVFINGLSSTPIDYYEKIHPCLLHDIDNLLQNRSTNLYYHFRSFILHRT